MKSWFEMSVKDKNTFSLIIEWQYVTSMKSCIKTFKRLLGEAFPVQTGKYLHPCSRW